MNALCECGCGNPAPIAKVNRRAIGHVAGEPVRFISGHNQRGRRWRMSAQGRKNVSAARREQGVAMGSRNPQWRGDEAGYGSLHAWVARYKTKTGTCEKCCRTIGTVGHSGTQWANISGDYRRDLDDFRELCPRCNVRERFAA